MLKKYRPYIQSAALFYLSEGTPSLAFLKAIAFLPFLLELRLNKPLKDSILIVLLMMTTWSLSIFLSKGPSDSYPILNTVALILFVLTKKSLGPQRAYIALIFFWLSAEALPYSFPILQGWSYPFSQGLFKIHFLKDWLSVTGYLGASFWLILLNLTSLALIVNYTKPAQWKTLAWSFGLLITVVIVFPIEFSPSSPFETLSDYPSYGKALFPADLFLSRMSYFLAFFLLLFLAVKHILRKSKRDDRFT